MKPGFECICNQFYLLEHRLAWLKLVNAGDMRFEF
jgi:hypothetical protein